MILSGFFLGVYVIEMIDIATVFSSLFNSLARPTFKHLSQLTDF